MFVCEILVNNDYLTFDCHRYRTMFFHAFSSTKEFCVSTELLQNYKHINKDEAFHDFKVGFNLVVIQCLALFHRYLLEQFKFSYVYLLRYILL